MIKSILKFSLIFLLFISILAVSLLGFSFYDFGYNAKDKDWFANWTTEVPGLITEDAILTNRQFGGGSSVFLAFSEESEGNITAEDYQKSATILLERFKSMGYTDTTVEVADGNKIRVDFSQKKFIDSVIAEVAAPGEWNFVGSDMSKTVCDGTMIEDAYVSANPQGGYAITLKFTEAGAKTFASNTATYAATGSSFYLMIDGQFMAVATVANSNVNETFSFGSYDYQSASMVATIMKHGALPAAMVIESTAPLAANISTGIQIAIFAVIGLALMVTAVALILKGKAYGVFAALAFLANLFVFAISMQISSVMLTIATLITMVLLMAIAAIFYWNAVSDVNQNGLKSLSKANAKAIWLHAILFAISIIGWLFARGIWVYITKALLVFSCANFIFYFLFFVFGTYTYNEYKKEKEEK